MAVFREVRGSALSGPRGACGAARWSGCLLSSVSRCWGANRAGPWAGLLVLAAAVPAPLAWSKVQLLPPLGPEGKLEHQRAATRGRALQFWAGEVRTRQRKVLFHIYVLPPR
jgi:hypothetical protein